MENAPAPEACAGCMTEAPHLLPLSPESNENEAYHKIPSQVPDGHLSKLSFGVMAPRTCSPVSALLASLQLLVHLIDVLLEALLQRRPALTAGSTLRMLPNLQRSPISGTAPSEHARQSP